jgi:iron complex outermembrane receptor protein
LPLVLVTTVWGQGGLADASLEQLLNTQVTSVSKKEERLARTAASVFVINQEDIKRSGARNLPDVLRMVPGVDVAQIDANAWAISIRGFNERYSNKLLVLVDGRSVYAPEFSGVYWDQIDIPLEDIDRIEVIRGPGASAWGANAVNGVISITTKPSKATQGGLASVVGGSEIDGDALVRYGGAISDSGTFRGFAKYSSFGSSILADGSDAHDEWSRIHGGFRSDWTLTPSDSLTVQGNLFSNRGSQSTYHWFTTVPGDTPFRQEVDAAGGNLLARWNHTFANGSSSSLQTYYDQFRRNDIGEPDSQKTFDVDFQHHFSTGRHDIVWGVGYRRLTTDVPPGYVFALTPPKRTDALYSSFFQDEVQLANTVWLTFGSKFEHNAYTGFEYEPNIRIAWAPDSRNTFWASASRAIRQPSRLETAVNVELAAYPINQYLTQALQLRGNSKFRSEQLHDYEAGYRAQLTRTLSADLDSFLSFYRDLATFEPLTPELIPGLITQIQIPIQYRNGGKSINYGGEASLNWSVNSRWRIAPGYSLLHVNLRLNPGSQDPFTQSFINNAPRHMLQMRSFINLSRRLEWDQTFYWQEAFPNGTIPNHARVDSRLAWRASESVEVSLAGQNLLRPDFMEMGNFQEVAGAQAPRSLTGKITWTF